PGPFCRRVSWQFHRLATSAGAPGCVDQGDGRTAIFAGDSRRAFLPHTVDEVLHLRVKRFEPFRGERAVDIVDGWLLPDQVPRFAVERSLQLPESVDIHHPLRADYERPEIRILDARLR